jgi:carbon dioxide concentrating mechanism protein CcmN
LGFNRPIEDGSISSSNNFPHNLQTTKEKETYFWGENIEDIWLEKTSKIEEKTEIMQQPNPNPDSQAENQNYTNIEEIYINKLWCTLFPERQAFNRYQ